MEYLLIGFLTSLSLILAIGAQNIFVIEQGLKKQHIFLSLFYLFNIRFNLNIFRDISFSLLHSIL